MELAPDFNEFFDSLIAHDVEFLIVGGYALAFYGAPRYTGDIDILFRPTPDNAERLLKSLEAFGFPIGELGAFDIINPARMLQMGVEPVQIHVMSAIDGVSWDEAWAGRQMGSGGRRELPFIGRREFIKNKKAVGRLKDLADVEAIGEE
jgi:hypothetical protein